MTFRSLFSPLPGWAMMHISTSVTSSSTPFCSGETPTCQTPSLDCRPPSKSSSEWAPWTTPYSLPSRHVTLRLRHSLRL